MDRQSGVLLHISSLPGSDGIGTLGKDAFDFVDFLSSIKQSIWQILPLGPVGFGNSPYQCYSAFAGNPMFIDIDTLVTDRLVAVNTLKGCKFKSKKVEFEIVEEFKSVLLKEAFKNFRNNFERFKDEYYDFLRRNEWWLNDYALFRSIKTNFGDKVWNEWGSQYVLRTKEIISQSYNSLSDDIDYHRFLQFQFFRQWFKLKNYANSQGIQIIGDIPLYVSFDSSDVWANQDIFILDNDAKPTLVGGVPPDYFSETGQLWGNPVFKWKRLAERDYDWWLARIHFNLNMFDLVRIDHFRGLESYWSVEAGEENAINGKWLPAYGYELLKKLTEQLGNLNIIAEDLGIITPEVEKFRDEFRLPGMKVLQFAFGSDPSNVNLPHNYKSNFLVYTGTHDNNTSLGWFNSIEKKEKQMLHKYVAGEGRNFVKNFIEYAWSSVANIAVIPMQDLLCLDYEARMNVPGEAAGNWGWRFTWAQIRTNHKHFIKQISVKYNRTR